MRFMRLAVKRRNIQATIPFLVAMVSPVAGQERRTVSAEDYARAERTLPATAAALVSGLAGEPTWLPDGRFWYRRSVLGGGEFVLVDPATRARSLAFDHARVAAALTRVADTTVSPLKLTLVQIAGGGRTVQVGARRFTCD